MLLVLPAVLLLCALTLYPVAYGIWISLFSKHSFFPETSFVGLGNYLAVFADEEFWRALKLGLIYSLTTIALQLALGVGAALLLNEAFARFNLAACIKAGLNGLIASFGLALVERESERFLLGIQEQLDQVTASSPESERAATLRAQLSQIGEEMERLEEEIRRRNPRYAEVRYPTPLRLDQIQGLLDQHTALLEYFIGRESSFLFFVTRESLSVHRLPAASTLAVSVQELRSTLAQGGILSLGRFRRAAGDLYQVLLGSETARLAHAYMRAAPRRPDVIAAARPSGTSGGPFDALHVGVRMLQRRFDHLVCRRFLRQAGRAFQPLAQGFEQP